MAEIEKLQLKINSAQMISEEATKNQVDLLNENKSVLDLTEKQYSKQISESLRLHKGSGPRRASSVTSLSDK